MKPSVKTVFFFIAGHTTTENVQYYDTTF